MPPDKPSNGQPAKPLTPNISSAFRHTKSPLTPRVFGSSNASPAGPGKRGLHAESATASAKRNADGQSTPTLTGNITPRSTARRSRIGTESPSTPDGGARSPRPKLVVERDRPKEVSGLGILSAASQGFASPGLKDVENGTRRPLLAQKSPDSVDGVAATTVAAKFFHADEVKSSVSSPGLDQRPQLGPKPSTFYRANETVRPRSEIQAATPAPRAVQKQEYGNKFFHVSDQPSSRQPAPKPSAAERPLSPSGRSSRFPSPEMQRNAKSAQRPQSPLKESTPSIAPGAINPTRSKSVTSPGNAVRYQSTVALAPQQASTSRRTSISSSSSALRKPGHRKSASTTSNQSTPLDQTQTPKSIPTKKPIGSVSPKATCTQHLARPPTLSLSPKVTSPQLTSPGSSNSIPSSLTLDTGRVVIHAISPIQSPTKPDGLSQPPSDKLQKINELAANARRERKVLDLEISNSSLLAINKTLEREMRKQSAELRRFRRLSRSGRFSMAAGSLRSASGQSMLSALTEVEDDRRDLSDLDEQSNQDNDDDDDEDDLDSSFDDDSSALLSPTTRAEHDARHRAKDEKRLMLDLSKHRQLLVDSEKMSQSIKRCLGWTEDLIKEGNRALEYHVKVSDVELGGRVLSRDDEGEGEEEMMMVDLAEAEPGKGLLSPSSTMNTLDEAKLWATALSQVDGLEGEEPDVLQPD